MASYYAAGFVSSGGIFNAPAADGTSGQVLQTDGNGNLSFVDQASGGTPGGVNGDIQFNNNGGFGGFADWNGSRMQVDGQIYAITASSPEMIVGVNLSSGNVRLRYDTVTGRGQLSKAGTTVAEWDNSGAPIFYTQLNYVVSTTRDAAFLVGEGTSGAKFGQMKWDRANNKLVIECNSGIVLNLSHIPTSDPGYAGQLWRTGTALQISLG